jgi:hypothetical protein
MKPQRYPKAGDIVELGIDGLGVQRQRVTGARQCAALMDVASASDARKRTRFDGDVRREIFDKGTGLWSAT